jgi:hypothetical protein
LEHYLDEQTADGEYSQTSVNRWTERTTPWGRGVAWGEGGIVRPPRAADSKGW